MEHTHEQDETEQQDTPTKSARRKWIVIAGIIGIIILIIVIPLAWLYTGTINEAKAKVFAKVPLPAAAVGTQLVTMQDVLHRYDIAKEVLGAEAAESQRSELHGQILDRLIADAQGETEASKLGIRVTDTEVEDQYQKLIAQLTGGDAAQFEAAVKENYKLSLDEFKQEVIRPDLLQTKLQTWFNNQRDLNGEAYGTADEIKQKLNSGENFGQLAKQYSDDETSKNLEGDAGTISISDMLPEFQAVLRDAKSGDVQQITSRYGQHIVKVIDRDDSEGADKAKLHVQQIFLQQDGFTEWYDAEVAKLKIYRFIDVTA